MRKFAVLIFFAALIMLIGCDSNNTTNPENPVDENNNGYESLAVANVLVVKCAGCHSPEKTEGGLSLSNYSEMIKGSSNRSNGMIPDYGGEDAIPQQPGRSLLYQMLMGNVTPAAPHDAITLTDAEKETIRQWIADGMKDNNGNLPFQNPSYRVYACNQNSDLVSVIDGDFKIVSGLINVDFLLDIADKPHMVKVKNGFLYVTLISAGKFLKFRISDFSKQGEVSGITKAGMIQITPDGTKAYISRSSTSDPVFSTIAVVDINSMSMIKEILLPAPGVPHGIALSPDGSRLYIANLTLDRISIVDAVNDEFIEDIVLSQGTEPMQTTMSPDGNFLYVSARGTGSLLVINTMTNNVIAEVSLGGGPMHISVTSDGNKIYIPLMFENSVAVVEKNGTSWTKTKEITHPGFNLMHGSDITPDDKYLYVSSRNNDGAFKPYYEVTGEHAPGTLGIIDIHTDQVIKLIELEEFSAGLTVGN